MKWPALKLRRAGHFHAGAGFPHEHQGSSSDDLPFVKVADLASGSGEIVTAANYVSVGTAAKLGARPAPAGTILFAKVGAALGKNHRRLTGRPLVFDNNVMGFCPLRDQHPRFWLYALSCIDMTVWANPGPVPSINEGQLKDIEVPAPNLDEQRHIADFLDRETTRIDELAASMDAADDLYRERFARRLRWVFGGERARGTDPFKAFAEAAKGTPRRLGASGMWLSGGTPPRGTAAYWDGAVPWCSSKDLRRYNIDDTEEHISEGAIKHAGWIPTDGILISTRGMSLAKRLPVAKVARAMAFNQDLKGLVLSAMWNPDYVLMCLRAAEPDILALCEQASHGTYKLPTPALQRFQIPYLPHEEQRKLVRAVLKHERHQELLSATRRRQVGLLREYRRALITEAVTGQLDPRRTSESEMEERVAEVVS